jgi:polysaccharide pyruvyl transferase WcaK-like protein
VQFLLEVREEIWHRFPRLFSSGWPHALKALSSKRKPTQAKPEDGIISSKPALEIEAKKVVNVDFLQAIQNADLIVATGGGYLCDAEPKDSLQVFETLEMAIRLGKPTAMVGQGVGPMQNPGLRSRLSKLLPALDIILIREPKVARPLLEGLGVSSERVFMTGDDAIEMAYEARAAKRGEHIGVNLRLAGYTEVGQTFIEKIRPTLHQFARKYEAPLMALPTSSNVIEADLEYICQILDGYEKVSIDRRRYNQPLDLIKKIGRCRLVVTGAFHPALFALSQGIPVIGLFKSTYSYNKFAALRDEFGSACQILNLDDEKFSEELATAMDVAWISTDEIRHGLLEAAVRQIEWGWVGYQHLYNRVTQKEPDGNESRTIGT